MVGNMGNNGIIIGTPKVKINDNDFIITQLCNNDTILM